MTANWFGNSMWTSPGSGYSAASMHAMFSAGLYEREQEEIRRREEEEAGKLEDLKKDQSSTRCYDSDQCASGFACVGGKCAYVDPTGATGDGGTAGCGAGVGGSGGSGGGGTGGSGCGGPAASSGASGTVATIQACTTSSAGSCLGLRGSAGGGGGGGGSSCGKRCCSCGTNGCTCYEGECPPQPPTCSRFCSEADGLGANVMSCGPKECDICHYCDDLVSPPVCKKDQPGADCRCGYQCPGCMQCSFAGNCLIKNCPSPPKPPEEPPANNCEPECRDTEVCVTNSSTGEVTCSTVQQCGDLPEECEPCDCNCNDECPKCQLCNSAGKCVPDPACDECFPDSVTVRARSQPMSYCAHQQDCDFACTTLELGSAYDIRQTFTASCGPITPVLTAIPQKVVESTGTLCGRTRSNLRAISAGRYDFLDKDGNNVGNFTWNYAEVSNVYDLDVQGAPVITFS